MIGRFLCWLGYHDIEEIDLIEPDKNPSSSSYARVYYLTPVCRRCHGTHHGA